MGLLVMNIDQEQWQELASQHDRMRQALDVTSNAFRELQSVLEEFSRGIDQATEDEEILPEEIVNYIRLWVKQLSIELHEILQERM